MYIKIIFQAQPKLQIKPHFRNTQRLARNKTKSECLDVSPSKPPELKVESGYDRQHMSLMTPAELLEEKAFLGRLNDFMVDNPDLYPKLVWMGLRDSM